MNLVVTRQTVVYKVLCSGHSGHSAIVKQYVQGPMPFCAVSLTPLKANNRAHEHGPVYQNILSAHVALKHASYCPTILSNLQVDTTAMSKPHS